MKGYSEEIQLDNLLQCMYTIIYILFVSQS